MSHAEKCPVCGGTGKEIIYEACWVNSPSKPCHSCCGKGWITVEDYTNYNLATKHEEEKVNEQS